MNNTTGSTVQSGSAGANVLIVLMDSIILVLSLSGNSMVVYTILKERKLQTKCNYLLLNLAVCDIIVVTLGTSIDIMLQFTKSKWVLGNILCRTISPTMTMFYISGSLIMVVISLDRYKMFVHPLRARYQRKHVKYSVIAVHTISLACVIPFSIFSTIADGYCYDVWPALWYRKSYTVFLFLMQYALPLLIMAVAYTGVAISLLRNKSSFKKKYDSRRGSTNQRTSLHSSIGTSSISSYCPHVKETKPVIPEVHEATELAPIESDTGQNEEFASNQKQGNCVSVKAAKLESGEMGKNDDKVLKNWKKPTLGKSMWVTKGLKNGSSGVNLIITNGTSSRRQRWKMQAKGIPKGGHHTEHDSWGNALSRRGGVRRRAGGVSTAESANMKRDKRNNRALKMILLVVVVFAIFMLPMQIMSLILDFGGKPTPERYKIYAWFVMCSYFGSCTLNPFIYGLVDRTFRASFKKIGKKIAKMCNCKTS